MDETYGKKGGDQKGAESTAFITKILDAIDLHHTQIDPTLRNRYARQPELLAAWHTASRLERAPQRRPKNDDGASPGPAAGGTSIPAK